MENAKIDALAITNHDIFDLDQFNQINAELDTTVFPGIEVNLQNGHVLVISDGNNLEDFDRKTSKVSDKINAIGDFITFEEFQEIFVNLENYLIIPHYQKNPPVKGEAFENLLPFIEAGEVDSAKKFIRLSKDKTELTPVLFSDSRMRVDMPRFPTRQTYIDCGNVTLKSIKASLKDRSKVALTENDGNKLFQIFDNGQKLSTGLNILLGERSSGKTYTLNQIHKVLHRTKYIRQFSLVQQDEETYEREFNEHVERSESIFKEEYLTGFKKVINDVINIDLHQNDSKIDKYYTTLMQSADEAEKKDAFSKTELFDEQVFNISDENILRTLIGSVRMIIENIEFKEIIEKHINLDSMKELAVELIELLWEKGYEGIKKKYVNGMVQDIQANLRRRTSATPIADINFYSLFMDDKKIDKFEEIVDLIKKVELISEEDIQGFKVVTKKRAFEGAMELRKISKSSKAAFKEAYQMYDQPYKYLQALKEIDPLKPSDFYRYFTKIDYEILNKDGNPVSGGERSEFRLLQEIKDAQNHDILLIDEPESSFDNIFLNAEVNQIIKEISENMPVVVVTHNSTVGASIKPDYLLYASREKDGEEIVFKLYSGHPTDKELFSLTGESRKNYDITIDSLEAGKAAYEERKQAYENIEN